MMPECCVHTKPQTKPAPSPISILIGGTLIYGHENSIEGKICDETGVKLRSRTRTEAKSIHKYVCN